MSSMQMCQVNEWKKKTLKISLFVTTCSLDILCSLNLLKSILFCSWRIKSNKNNCKQHTCSILVLLSGEHIIWTLPEPNIPKLFISLQASCSSDIAKDNSLITNKPSSWPAFAARLWAPGGPETRGLSPCSASPWPCSEHHRAHSSLSGQLCPNTNTNHSLLKCLK